MEEHNQHDNRITAQDVYAWFNGLPFEDKIRVFSFYHIDKGSDASPIGTLQDVVDQKAMSGAYESASADLGLYPQVDEHLIRKSIEAMLGRALSSLSGESVMQVYRETTAAGIEPIQDPKALRRGPSIEDILVDKLTVGGDVLDRETFYVYTKGMTQEGLDKMKESVRSRVYAYYDSLTEPDNNKEQSRKTTDKLLTHWFRPWTRLAGRIDEALMLALEAHEGDIDEKLLADVCTPFLSRAEYQPYRDMQLTGYVYSKCIEYKLDYTKLPDTLKSTQMEESFRKDFPFCVEDKEWDILKMAYDIGKKHRISLQEEPSLSNGYIGGTVDFSRYMELPFGPVVAEGKLTGIAQIDYTDCTNVFVIVDYGKKAIAFDALDTYAKKSVLERIWDKNKYGQKQSPKAEATYAPNQEELAQEAIEMSTSRDDLSGLITIRANDALKNFNLIADRLSGERDLLIYNSHELRYYGTYWREIGAAVQTEYGGLSAAYYGSSASGPGYMGTPYNHFSADELEKLSEEILAAIQEKVITPDTLATVKDADLQLELTGRINGALKDRDGDSLIVQKDGDKLLAMRPTTADEYIEKAAPGGNIAIEGKELHLDNRQLLCLSYGLGQYVQDKNGQRAYVVFDLKRKTIVPATPFDTLKRDHCTKLSKAADAKATETQKETKNTKKSK